MATKNTTEAAPTHSAARPFGSYDAAPSASLPIRARLFHGAVLVGALATATPWLHDQGAARSDWIAFAVIAVVAAFAHLFVVVTPRNQSYHSTIVCLLPAVILLPPKFLLLVAIAQHLPEWLRARYAVDIQTFNIANYAINMAAAAAAYHGVVALMPADDHYQLPVAVGGLAAAVTLVGLNHLLLATMLRLGRGHSFRNTGLFGFESLSTDLVLALLGVIVAFLVVTNPALVPLALAPLAILQRSLSVPALEAEARIDPKTGLFNAKHFAAVLEDEVARAARFERPLTVVMADLDLLRDINNTYGHLAGDAVLVGVADVFRSELRAYDVAARFGGEEFSILLPETPVEEALEVAERVCRAVAEQTYDVATASEPIRATISMGVATLPADGREPTALLHQADRAVYRAKFEGRNRVVQASREAIEEAPSQAPRPRLQLAAAPPKAAENAQETPEAERRRPRQRGLHGVAFRALPIPLALFVAFVAAVAAATGVAGLLLGGSTDVVGLLAVVALVAVGQALAVDVAGAASLSYSAVGLIAGAALFGPRAALVLAATTCIVDWSARRIPLHRVLFNIATLTLAMTVAAGVYGLVANDELLLVALGAVAGTAYFLVNTGLLTIALAIEGRRRVSAVFREHFAWLLPHYAGYGVVAAVIAIAYEGAGIYALAGFSVPLLLTRTTQTVFVSHATDSARKLRDAAETIQRQNDSLEEANRLLKERSVAAMESLSATVDARDSYTAGHSRRVQEIALAIARELGLTGRELEVVGQAALFHDIGKIAVPDAVLLKPGALSELEWGSMQQHSVEGSRIIERLGFLDGAVPVIRHHHERWDGTGYPDGLAGDSIPVLARIVHVADALDSMLTTRVYRRALSPDEALAELIRGSGTQFCPRCVTAAARIFASVRLGPKAGAVTLAG